MVTVPIPLLIFHVPRNMFQEDSIHDFAKSQPEADSMILWITPLAFFEGVYDLLPFSAL